MPRITLAALFCQSIPASACAHQAPCAIGAEPMQGASNIPGRPHIYPMPENALALLRQLHELLKARHGDVAPRGITLVLPGAAGLPAA